jgi:uncharacterized integral membrane protein
MRTWGTVIAGIAVAALFIFTVLSNDAEVTVVMPLLQWRTKLWGAMVASAVFGAAASMVLVTWPLLRLKLQSRKHTKRIAQLEQEVHGLRTLPIASDSAASSSSSAQKV